MLTASEYQRLLVDEVGLETIPALRKLVPSVWKLYAEKAFIAPRLQYLYAKRHLIEAKLLSLSGTLTDEKEGDEEKKNSQGFANLRTMLKDVSSEIETADKAARAGTVVVGVMTTIAPVQVPDGYLPDPNRRGYRGDPFDRTGSQ